MSMADEINCEYMIFSFLFHVFYACFKRVKRQYSKFVIGHVVEYWYSGICT